MSMTCLSREIQNLKIKEQATEEIEFCSDVFLCS
jgi:hypothetical protein